MRVLGVSRERDTFRILNSVQDCRCADRACQGFAHRARPSSSRQILGRSIPVLLLGSTFLFAALTARGEEPAAPDGKQIFLTNKCNTCHTIQPATIENKKAADG